MKTKIYRSEEEFAKDWTDMPPVIGDPVQQHEVFDRDDCVLGYIKTFSHDMTNGYGDDYKMRLQLVYQSYNEENDQLQEPILLQMIQVDDRKDFLFALTVMWADTMDFVHNHNSLKEATGLLEL